jgi:hypothetical protein
MFLFTSLAFSAKLNKMRMLKGVFDGRHAFIPVTRLDMTKKILDKVQLYPKNATIKGSKQLYDKLTKMFRPLEKIPIAKPAEENKPTGSIDISGGYDKGKGGWYGQGGVSIKFAKPVEEENRATGEFGLTGGYSQFGGWNVGASLTIRWLQSLEEEENKPRGSVDISGGYDRSRGGWYGQGGISIQFAKPEEEENSRPRGIASGGWGKGGVSFQFAKAEEENRRKVSGSASITGGYSQGGGWNIGGSISINFINEDGVEETLYVTEVVSPDGCIYLPTFTKGKFDNLRKQLLEGTVLFD